MYGSVFRMKVKPGKNQAIADLFSEWDRERQRQVPGAIGGFVLRPDRAAGELIRVAVFKDKASYRANADDPAQHEWYMRMRELLEDDPEWEDGEYIAGGMS